MSTQHIARRLLARPEALTLQWSEGSADEYASIWLCDNAPAHRDPHSGQRLIDVADLPEAPRIRSAVLREGRVHIEWQDSIAPASFDLQWLAAHGAGTAHRRDQPAVHPWLDGASLDAARDFAWLDLRELRAAQARSGWLARLIRDGVAFLRAVPATRDALLDAMRLIGQVSETNYGLTFEVCSVPQPENLAYSDLGLGLHTDNPYREPVPGFQALHTLICSPDGGDSLFADGFALAEQLRTCDPGSFALLSRTPVPFHYRSQSAELRAERPMIELTGRGEVAAISYNSRSIAPLRLAAAEAVPFYAAYRRLAGLLREPHHQLKFKLLDGELVLFDNRRILHGRTPFSSARHPRHLRGCYLSRDSVHSAAGVLCRELDREDGDERGR
ncbi:MAG TPA: TauD/TfdA family dioxygenase [Steroidobacteraceae bacterium]|nr:TauD/TfdA family dioxygenase [Steroidobacteraceae bacterium]